MRVLLLVLSLVPAHAAADAARMALEFDRKATELYLSGRYHEAAHNQKQSIAVWTELSRTQKVDLGIPHFNLALIYLAQGKLSAAEHEAHSARELAGESLTAEAEGRISVLLAQIHFQVGDYTQAQLALEAALPKLNDVERSTALSDLGMTLASRGNLGEARNRLEASVAVREQADASAPGLGRILANLALVCFRQGDLARAGSLYEKAIRLMESADESNPRYVAMALAEYSQVLKKVGRRAEAKAVERRAKAIFADSTALRAHTVDIGSLRGTRAAQ